MYETRRLAPEDVDLWTHLLTPQVAGLVDPAAFKAWRDEIWTHARFGLVETWAVYPREAAGGSPQGVLLAQNTGGHRSVAVVAGAFEGEALREAIAPLMADAAALSWPSELAPDWADRLADLGVRRFEQQHWVNRLDVVLPRLAGEPPDPAIAPWDASRLDEVIALIGAANAGSVAGFMLSLPYPPTRSAIEAQARAMLAEGGSLLPEASFLYLLDGAVAGAVLIVALPDGPTLYELVVAPLTRGRGAGKHLVHAAQRALHAAGHREMRFWTTDTNAPVHRISKPGESFVSGATACACWFAGAGA